VHIEKSMITVKRETKESRKRDLKRKRLLLCVGEKKFHLSRVEGQQLFYALANILMRK
jgi:hypothetical protein